MPSATPLLLRSARLSPSQMAVLLELDARLQAAPLGAAVAVGGTDLGRSTGMGRQTAATALSSLARLGIVRRRVAPSSNLGGFYAIEPAWRRWACGFRVDDPVALLWSRDVGPLGADGNPIDTGRRGFLLSEGGAP
jgi:hypothetical protein